MTEILPIIKWAGGKRRITSQIYELINYKDYGTYFEPFLGGGSILFDIKPQKAMGIDSNDELICMYNSVRDDHSGLIRTLSENYVPFHSEQFFYETRSLDRSSSFLDLSTTERAARLIYLNRACYNGLWRVNKKGQNNVPYGHNPDAKILFEDRIHAMHNYLGLNDVSFISGDFTEVEKYAKEGDLVYFDPPYDRQVGHSQFTKYTSRGFTRENHKVLKNLCDRLIMKGVVVAVSNSKTQFILDLYKNHKYAFYEIHHRIETTRTIGSKSESRIKIGEILIVGKHID